MDLKACQVIELDSCAEEKFSRHLIIRLPGLAFCTNAHVGAFVRQVVAGLPQCPSTGDCSAVTGPAAGRQQQPGTASGMQTNPEGPAQAQEAVPSSAGAPQQPSESAATEPMLPLSGRGSGVLQAEVGLLTRQPALLQSSSSWSYLPWHRCWHSSLMWSS